MCVTYQVDHIVPELSGGTTESANLALTCPTCNGHKASKTHARDPHSGVIVRLFNPRAQIWSRHFRFALDQQTIEGRTRCGRATVVALQLNNENLVRLRAIWLTIGSGPPDWPTPEGLT